MRPQSKQSKSGGDRKERSFQDERDAVGERRTANCLILSVKVAASATCGQAGGLIAFGGSAMGSQCCGKHRGSRETRRFDGHAQYIAPRCDRPANAAKCPVPIGDVTPLADGSRTSRITPIHSWFVRRARQLGQESAGFLDSMAREEISLKGPLTRSARMDIFALSPARHRGTQECSFWPQGQ